MDPRSRTLLALAGLAVVAPTGASAQAPSARGIPCAELPAAHWGGFRVDTAEPEPGTDGTPTVCRVRGTIDTEIHFELLLPEPSAFNGRFVMGGGGGFVGNVENQALAYAPTLIADGYATAGTDTGHRGSGISAGWALNRPDRVVDFGDRAVHLTAETAKTIIRLHYGRDIDRSYFVGCSRGGGQAMMESQRFPDDFDGIVAGAPAYDWPAVGAQFVQTQQAMYPDPTQLSTPVVTADVQRLLGKAIVDACDDLDGLRDGLLTDPRQCRFRPEQLPRCPADEARPDCVTRAQLAAIEAVYRGAVVDGRQVFPGFPFGGEDDRGGWDAWITGSGGHLIPGVPTAHFAFGVELYKYIVFGDSTWSYASYDFAHWARDTRRAAAILNATNPDLTEFKVGGGKILFWHGWSDAGLTALGTVQYYEAVQRTDPDADTYARLFMLPGVLHCAGGPGPDQVDWLTAIRDWVEQGVAPTRLLATQRDDDGTARLTRPVCAYPARAVYDGRGDPDNAESFRCEAPVAGGAG